MERDRRETDRTETGESKESRKRRRRTYPFSSVASAAALAFIAGTAAACILCVLIGNGSIPLRLSGTGGENTAVQKTEPTEAASEKSAGENPDETAEAARTQLLSELRLALAGGEKILDLLRRYYPEDIVLYNTGRFLFIPVNEKLAMHGRKPEGIKKLEDGRWEYTESGKTVSRCGIDVSSHQGEIDWEKVKSAGVEFAIIRALYRGYSSGALAEDKQFKANVEGALKNGIRTGVYLFSQAVNLEEMDEETDRLLELIRPYSITGPVVLDVEMTPGKNGRADALSMDERTGLVLRFCERIEEAGYRPMIYFNIDSAMLLVDIDRLEKYDKWFAAYNDEMYFPYDYSIWQYSDSGCIDGINGSVDLDMAFGTD